MEMLGKFFIEIILNSIRKRLSPEGENSIALITGGIGIGIGIVSIGAQSAEAARRVELIRRNKMNTRKIFAILSALITGGLAVAISYTPAKAYDIVNNSSRTREVLSAMAVIIDI